MSNDSDIRLACIEHARNMLTAGGAGTLGNDALSIAKVLYDWVIEGKDDTPTPLPDFLNPPTTYTTGAQRASDTQPINPPANPGRRK